MGPSEDRLWRNWEQHGCCKYRNQLQALCDNHVDAIFAKGPEAALLEQEGAGRIRLLFDLRRTPSLHHRVNNSTPRLFTTSRRMLDLHRDAVVRYLATAVRADAWAVAQPGEARALVARECAVPEQRLDAYLVDEYVARLQPGFDPEHIEALHIMKDFLLERSFIETDVDLHAWAEPQVLQEAIALAAALPAA